MFDLYSAQRVRFTTVEAELLTAGCKAFHLKKGEVLYNAGEPGEMVYYLRKGRTKYHMIDPEGNNRNTAFSEAPDFVGVIHVLPGLPTINCCTAVTACELVACPAELFLDRVEEYGLMRKLLQFSVETSRHIYTSLTALMNEDRARLVDMLRNDQDLTLQETADFLGCSRVHVSRLCKQLEEEK